MSVTGFNRRRRELLKRQEELKAKETEVSEDAENVVQEQDWDNEPENNEPEGNEDEFEGKGAKQLYKMCRKRGIKCEPKKDREYYINLLTAE